MQNAVIVYTIIQQILGRLRVGALFHGLCLQLQYPAAQVGIVLLKVADHVSLSLQQLIQVLSIPAVGGYIGVWERRGRSNSMKDTATCIGGSHALRHRGMKRQHMTCYSCPTNCYTSR